MPVRTATRRWPDLATFLREYPTTLKVHALTLPADLFAGDEPAPEMKLDLVLPLAGRVGPVSAQLIARMPDGGAAMRIPEMPTDARDAVARVLGAVDEVRAHLLATGAVVLPGTAPEEVAELRGELDALRAEAERLRAAASAASTGASAAATARAPEGSSEPTPTARGFALPQLAGRPVREEGSLADDGLRAAGVRLALARVTGILVVEAHGEDGVARTWTGYWSRGGPVGWRADPLEEQDVLGVLLYRAGRVTREQLEESLARMDARGCRQGEALVDMGVLQYPEMVMLLQRQADHVFQRLLRLREGRWRFHDLDELPERFLPPPVRVLANVYRALQATAKATPAEVLAAEVKPWLDRYPSVPADIDAVLAEVKASAEEVQFVKLLRQAPRRLRDVFGFSNLSRSQTGLTIWSLVKLGVLGVHAESAAATAAMARPMIPDVEAGGSRGAATGSAPRTAQSAFERVGLHWMATAEEVAAAKVDGNDAGSRDALALLRDDASRRAHRVSIVGVQGVADAVRGLAARAEAARARGDTAEARVCLLRALELDPGATGVSEALSSL
ncbi:MAG: hypothetical protein RLZZ299_2041 [Pseudomonadota bacterium]|jgi:hypothetical protein